eukprot:1161107-Pelagomonas_calceolata.AAC.7
MSAESLGPSLSSTSVLSCPQVHLAVHLAASTVLKLQVTYKSSTSCVVVIVLFKGDSLQLLSLPCKICITAATDVAPKYSTRHGCASQGPRCMQGKRNVSAMAMASQRGIRTKFRSSRRRQEEALGSEG